MVTAIVGILLGILIRIPLASLGLLYAPIAIGLWEGIFVHRVALSFATPAESYVGYFLRIVLDFFVTRSLARVGIVVVWSGLGLLLSQVLDPAFVANSKSRPSRTVRRSSTSSRKKVRVTRRTTYVTIPPEAPEELIERIPDEKPQSSPSVLPAPDSDSLSTVTVSASTPTQFASALEFPDTEEEESTLEATPTNNAHPGFPLFPLVPVDTSFPRDVVRPDSPSSGTTTSISDADAAPHLEPVLPPPLRVDTDDTNPLPLSAIVGSRDIFEPSPSPKHVRAPNPDPYASRPDDELMPTELSRITEESTQPTASEISRPHEASEPVLVVSPLPLDGQLPSHSTGTSPSFDLAARYNQGGASTGVLIAPEDPVDRHTSDDAYLHDELMTPPTAVRERQPDFDSAPLRDQLMTPPAEPGSLPNTQSTQAQHHVAHERSLDLKIDTSLSRLKFNQSPGESIVLYSVTDSAPVAQLPPLPAHAATADDRPASRTVDESDSISGSADRDVRLSSAERYRKKARQERSRALDLQKRSEAAAQQRHHKEAFLLRKQSQDALTEEAKQNLKARKRFVEAHDTDDTINVYGLLQVEALERIEAVLQHRITRGIRTSLRVVVGSQANRIPLLRNKIIDEMTKQHFDCRVDRSDTSVVVVTPPA
ncbi:hypothetical protein FISHEDRAFT_61922 [Fistulina hepatica ATCC 64428]|uniref:Smr domain-containing protein n=1 Tax=Fistulina hepatica ATCC 64428 TaxID=1128425 RepID=A0A0D7A0S2_9AGAR|nr:hypothetical protein FISHEDRAFT_61922 [Fistulina hepatica ATCC 64428]